MNNACPSCGTTYQVQHKNIGRHIKCKICGTALFVAEDGLRLDETPPPGGGDTEAFAELGEGTVAAGSARFRQRRAARDFAASFAATLRLLPDLSTCLFGSGVLCVLICLFMPLIDNAALLSKQATLRGGELRERNRENWQQERRDLLLAIDETRTAHDKWEYWYRWGMLLGFILLALGSLGYLQPEQPTIRRVVGAIVLVAMVLLIFLLFLVLRGLR